MPKRVLCPSCLNQFNDKCNDCDFNNDYKNWKIDSRSTKAIKQNLSEGVEELTEWRTVPGSPLEEKRLCTKKGIVCEFADVSGCMSTACNKLFDKEANKMEDVKKLQKITVKADFDKEAFQKEQDLIIGLVEAGLVTDKDGVIDFVKGRAKKFINFELEGARMSKKENLSINVEVTEGMSKRDLHDICHKIAKRIQWGDTFSAGVFKDAANKLWSRWVEEENDAKAREKRRQEQRG